MKYFAFLLTLLYLLSPQLEAQNYCRVTGYLYKEDGSLAINTTVTIKKITNLNGEILVNRPSIHYTNSNGLLSIRLFKNSIAWVYADLPGLRGDNNSGQQVVIPNTDTASIGSLLNASAIYVYQQMQGVDTTTLFTQRFQDIYDSLAAIRTELDNMGPGVDTLTLFAQRFQDIYDALSLVETEVYDSISTIVAQLNLIESEVNNLSINIDDINGTLSELDTLSPVLWGGVRSITTGYPFSGKAIFTQGSDKVKGIGTNWLRSDQYGLSNYWSFYVKNRRGKWGPYTDVYDIYSDDSIQIEWNWPYASDTLPIYIFYNEVGKENIALGQHTNGVLGQGNIAIGNSINMTSTGNYNKAIGSSITTTTDGSNSVAIGSSISVRSTLGVSIGTSLINQYIYNTVLGVNNVGRTPTYTAAPSTWNATDPIFEVGIGNPSLFEYKNAMTILKNGKIGLLNFTPDSLLTIGGPTAMGGIHVHGGAKIEGDATAKNFYTSSTSTGLYFASVQAYITQTKWRTLSGNGQTLESKYDAWHFRSVDAAADVAKIDIFGRARFGDAAYPAVALESAGHIKMPKDSIIEAGTLKTPLIIRDSLGWVVSDSVRWRLKDESLPESVESGRRCGWREFELLSSAYTGAVPLEFSARADSANGTEISHIEYEVHSRCNVSSGTAKGTLYMNGGGYWRGNNAYGSPAGAAMFLDPAAGNNPTYKHWPLRVRNSGTTASYWRVIVRVHYQINAGNSSYYVTLTDV